MGDTKIEWTEKTWNPVRGCSRVSDGCRNCYAERQAIRIPAFGKFVRSTDAGPRWTGQVELMPGRLSQPLRWRKPRLVFVNSMSDLFHEKLSNDEIAAVFGVMAAAHQHTFQVLTKRPERMREWFAWAADQGEELQAGVGEEPPSGSPVPAACALAATVPARLSRSAFNTAAHATWPLPNVWLGVSVEDQATADERIPFLLENPAAIRFVSYEPALGPVDFTAFLGARDVNSVGTCARCGYYGPGPRHDCAHPPASLSWVIAGSESGPGARPAELDWFRSVRDQCAAAGVPFFFKQWVGDKQSTGGVARDRIDRRGQLKVSLPVLDGRQHVDWPR